MSDAKHTPGPWSVWVLNDEALITDDKYARHLAAMRGGAPETEANARLIAKAPEMFELLRSILLHEEMSGIGDHVNEARGYGASLECTPKLRKWLNDADALLTVIKGES